MKFIVYIFSIILFNLLLLGCKPIAYKEDPASSKAVLNLHNTDFKKSKIIKLKGEWEFYWQKFIASEPQTKGQADTIVKLPAIWNDYTIKGKKLKSFGYASYRLKVLFKDSIDAICFKMQDIPTSSELYVNGLKIYSAGRIGKTKKTCVPDEKPGIAYYLKRTNELEIILQVANFNHRKGGPIRPIEMGTPEVVTSARETEIGTQLFLFGALFIMGLYHLGIFALRRDEKSPLYFAAFSISIGFYTLITGETYIKYMWPNSPWELLLKLEYIIIIWASPFFLQFLIELYEKHVNRRFVRFNLFVSITVSTFVVISDPYHYSQVMPYYHFWIYTIAIYCIFVLTKAAFGKENNARLFLVGFAAIFVTIIHDILLNKGLIHSTDLVPYGFFAFIFSQAYLLSAKFSKAFAHVSLLKNELTYINKNLEKMVEIRTHELNSQKEEILVQKEEIEEQQSELEKAFLLIEKSNKNITDSIKYAKKIQQAAFPSDEMIRFVLPDSFIYFKPKDIVSGDFYWVRQNKSLTYIAVADCTGHGVPGGFMSMLGIAFLTEITNKEIEDASQILNELRQHTKLSLRQMNDKFEQKDGMDISLCILNLETNVMQFAGANNNLHIFRDFKPIEYKGDKMPIGVYRKERPFTNNTIQMQPEDRVYMFSDGYASQFGGERNEKFKTKKLFELLTQIHPVPMETQRSVISHTMDAWKGGNEQIDDMLVVGFKIY